jgi:hypothetical protein
VLKKCQEKELVMLKRGLTKITGITKVESRGLFVRGLEDTLQQFIDK